VLVLVVRDQRRVAGDGVVVLGDNVDTVVVEYRFEPLADGLVFDRGMPCARSAGSKSRYISTRLSVSASSAEITSIVRSSRSVIVRGGCGNSPAGSSGYVRVIG